MNLLPGAIPTPDTLYPIYSFVRSFTRSLTHSLGNYNTCHSSIQAITESRLWARWWERQSLPPVPGAARCLDAAGGRRGTGPQGGVLVRVLASVAQAQHRPGTWEAALYIH